MPIIAAGTTALALGNGLVTLVRPHLVQTLFSVESGGMWNGRIARHQQLARAGGPILVAWLATTFTYAALLALFALTFMIAALIALVLSGRIAVRRLRIRPHDFSATCCVPRQSPTSSLVSGECMSPRHSPGGPDG